MVRSFRGALSNVLQRVSKENPKIAVFNADSARALNLSEFAKNFPERIFCFGISEADMISQAAGISTTGVIPVIVGFSMFVSHKPLEQIRQSICYPNLNVKIIATHAGLCVGKDGATHQNLEDLAILRTLPNMKIFVAADVAQTEKAIEAMLAHDGPCYLRLGRDLAQDIYETPPEVNEGGSDVLRDGGDAVIFACGLMVDQALKAAELLAGEKIQVAVINTYSVKPLDERTILEYAKKTGAAVSVEDHTVIGGLGGAVAELLAKNHPIPMEFVGVQDTFGESGEQDELYEKYGLTPQSIAAAVRKAVARKK